MGLNRESFVKQIGRSQRCFNPVLTLIGGECHESQCALGLLLVAHGLKQKRRAQLYKLALDLITTFGGHLSCNTTQISDLKALYRIL